jgi:hypothetical protein
MGSSFCLGISPLSVAIARRHWQTARLILAIATAQYQPSERNKGFSTRNVVLGAYNIWFKAWPVLDVKS